jgi:hypothetical protein
MTDRRSPISTVVLVLAIVAATLFLSVLEDPTTQRPLREPDPAPCTHTVASLDVQIQEEP